MFTELWTTYCVPSPLPGSEDTERTKSINSCPHEVSILFVLQRKVIFKASFIANVELALYSVNTHMGAQKSEELKSQLSQVVAVNVPLN